MYVYVCIYIYIHLYSDVKCNVLLYDTIIHMYVQKDSIYSFIYIEICELYLCSHVLSPITCTLNCFSCAKLASNLSSAGDERRVSMAAQNCASGEPGDYSLIVSNCQAMLPIPSHFLLPEMLPSMGSTFGILDHTVM